MEVHQETPGYTRKKAAVNYFHIATKKITQETNDESILTL